MTQKAIDKVGLDSACQLHIAGKVKKFSWAQQLPNDFFQSPLSIHLSDGSQVQTPVSLVVFERLKLQSSEAQCGSGQNLTYNPTLVRFKEIRLDPGVLCPLQSPQATDLLLSTVKRHFELPPNLAEDIGVKLDKLVLYEIGSHYKRSFPTDNQQVLGQIILHIPVEGGYDGGELFVHYNRKKLAFSNNQNSHCASYMTVFFNSCGHWMEPITRGASVCVVYDLFWKTPKENVIRDLPLLLTAIKEVEKALGSWIIPDEDVSPNPKILSESSVSGEEMENEEISHPVNTAAAVPYRGPNRPAARVRKEDIRFFLLKEKYGEYLSFERLRGEDRNMALVLQNCPFLECTLALVNRRVKNISYRDDSLYDSDECDHYYYHYQRNRTDSEKINEIIRWVDSADRQVHLDLELDWATQSFRGEIYDIDDTEKALYKSYKSKYQHNPKRSKYVEVEEEVFLHSILIIWPKHLTIPLYLKCGMESLVDRLESSYHSSESKEEIIPHIKQDLKQILETCSENIKNRKFKEVPNFPLMTRLLRFSTLLRAREEGLVALKALIETYDRDFRTGLTQEMCRAAAEFECRVAGWKDCTDLINSMLTRISRVSVMVMLAKCFLEVNCVEGVKAVVDFISSHTSLLKDHGSGESSDVTDYLALILTLEEDPSFGYQEKWLSFVDGFPHFKNDVKYRIVLSLENRCVPRCQESWKMVFESLCNTVSRSFTLEDCASYGLITRILQLFVRLGNREWVQSFVTDMTKAPCSAAKESCEEDSYRYSPPSPQYLPPGYSPPHYEVHYSRNSAASRAIAAKEKSKQELKLLTAQKALVDHLTACPAIYEMATSSELGKYVLVSFMDFNYANISVDGWSTEQPEDNRHIRRNKEKVKFLSYLDLVLRMENTPSLVDTSHIGIIISEMKKLTTDQLILCLHHVLKQPSKAKTGSGVLGEIFQVIYTRQKKSCNLPQTDKTLQLTGLFIRLADSDMTSRWVELICQQSIVASLGREERGFALFQSLLNSSEWKLFKCSDRLTTLNTSATLILTSMEHLHNKISKNYFVESPDQLTEGVRQCVDMFFLIESQRSSDHQKNISSRFEDLFVKLPLDFVMVFILDIYEKKKTDLTAIVKLPVCILKWYSNVLNFCLKQDFLAEFVSKNGKYSTKEIIELLLWFADDEAWENFASSVCSSKAFDVIIEPLGEQLPLQHVNTFKLVANSPPALDAFMKIVTHAESLAEQLVEPPFSWRQPSASYPGHPEVESFLRSDLEKFVVVKFKTIGHARQFAACVRLNQSSANYSVTAEASGSGELSQCIITKKRSYHNVVKESFNVRKKKLNSLLFLKWRLDELKGLTSNHELISEQIDLCSSASKSKALEVDSTSVEMMVGEPPKKRVKF